MPIFNNNAPVPPIIPTPVNVTPVPVIDTAASFSNFIIKDKVVGFIDGTPWTCKAYYAQFLGKDDVVVNSNDVNNPTIKQYLKIYDFELRVTTALSSSLDGTTGISTVTGEANVYPVITPVVGDIFIAVVQEGVDGIFEVTGINRASQFKESAWSITITQINYSTPELVRLYDSFVVGELKFDVTLLDSGSNPLRTLSEFNRSVEKDKLIKELVEEYYINFYNNAIGTFLVPSLDDPKTIIYDPFIIKFWNAFIGHEYYPSQSNPTYFDIKTGICNRPFNTIFDAVAQQSVMLAKHCVRALNKIRVVNMDATFQRHTLRANGIDYVIFPYLNDQVADNTLGPNDSRTPYIFSINVYNQKIPLLPSFGIQDADALLDSLKTVKQLLQGLTSDCDDPTSTIQETKTLFENLVLKVIKKEALVFRDILQVIANLPLLTTVDQFYFIPFILVMLTLSR